MAFLIPPLNAGPLAATRSARFPARTSSRRPLSTTMVAPPPNRNPSTDSPPSPPTSAPNSPSNPPPTTSSSLSEVTTPPHPSDFDPSLMDPVHLRNERVRADPVAIIVLGASGDLAKKKTFPAIFSLFYHGLLPAHFVLYGFARREMNDDEFRDIIHTTLTCRVIDGERCAEKMRQFLPRCFYHRGDYFNPDTFASLDRQLSTTFETEYPAANRLFYLAVPPKVFSPSCININKTGRAHKGWTRVVVEKPFGHDLDSYRELRSQLGDVLTEAETFRIDHFLAKELVQNLMTLRFANAIFEPLWNRHYIKSVQITFKENFGVEGRAGYFDNIGIVRDIMQNHLLQVLALLAMEPPVSLHAEDIRDEKVKCLRAINPLTADDFATGQYAAKDSHSKGYLEDGEVSQNSHTPTFASCVMHINNARWAGVPFLMRAGKALDDRKTEIRIQFRGVPGGLFPSVEGSEHNELVIRVQPDEAIYMRIVSKVPGLTSRMEEARLNLFYRHAWEESKDIPDAYERLILDVIQGEKSLFIRDDELDAAWKIFTPALDEMEEESSKKPEIYEYGSAGPLNSESLAARYDVRWSD